MTLETLYDDVEWEEPTQPRRSRWPLWTGIGLAVLAWLVEGARA